MTNQDKLINTPEEAIECIKKNRPTSGYQMLNEALDMAITALEKQESEKWHPINPDDLDSFPSDDRFVLVSFSNYEGVDIARWRMDAEGGMFCPGDEDYPYTRSGLLVNAWKERPERWTYEDVDE